MRKEADEEIQRISKSFADELARVRAEERSLLAGAGAGAGSGPPSDM